MGFFDGLQMNIEKQMDYIICRAIKSISKKISKLTKSKVSVSIVVVCAREETFDALSFRASQIKKDVLKKIIKKLTTEGTKENYDILDLH